MQRTILFFLVGVLAVVAGVFIRFVIPPHTSENETDKVVTVTECGSGGPGVSESDLEKIGSCISTNFKSCTSAKWDTSVDLGLLGGLVTYGYEILGPQNNLCLVKSSFIKNPNPEFLGKEMNCEYDNSKAFNSAALDITRCTGPLSDLINIGAKSDAVLLPDGSFKIQDTIELPPININE